MYEWSDNAYPPPGWFVRFECPALSFVDLAGWTDGVIIPDEWRCMIDLIMHFCLLDGFNRFECRVPSFEDLAGWTDSAVLPNE